MNAKEVQARGLYPACAAAQSATEEEDPPWQPKRTWNSPLQHFEDTATYDRRYVGRLVSPTSWSPRLALAMTRGGGHVEGWPRAAWQPSPRTTPELRARLSAEGVRQADKPPRPPGEILAEMDAQAARWEAESDLKAIYARATAATEAHRSVVSNYDEWWAEYQIRRDETLRLAAAARAAELDAIDQASARREREERDAAEAMKAELEQRRKQRMAEAARVDAMMAAQKAEMEEMRKAAARERLAKEREKAEREAERMVQLRRVLGPLEDERPSDETSEGGSSIYASRIFTRYMRMYREASFQTQTQRLAKSIRVEQVLHKPTKETTCGRVYYHNNISLS